MTYFDTILPDYPAAAWDLGNLKDLTGNDYAIVRRNTVVSAPILAGQASRQIGVDDELSFESDNLLRHGYESQPFAIEAWVYLTRVTGTAGLLVKEDDSGCGLYANPSNIYFLLRTQNYGDVVVEYKRPQHAEKTHVVVQYSGSALILYINGVEVDSFHFNAQPVFNDDVLGLLLKSSLANSTEIWSSELAGQAEDTTVELLGPGTDHFLTDSFSIAGVALYKRALESGKILNHYNVGNKVQFVETIATVNDTRYYQFDDTRVTNLTKFSWAGADFTTWTIDNLVSSVSGLQQVAGPDGWEFGSAYTYLSLGEIGTIQSAKVRFNDLHNIVVSVEPDGEDDFIEKNETQMVSLHSGFVATERYIKITIEFLPSTSNEASLLDEFVLSIYGDKQIVGNDPTIPAQLSETVIVGTELHHPLNANEISGSRILASDGYVSFPASPDFTYNAVEMWMLGVRGQIGTLVTIEGAGNLNAIYVDGQRRSIYKQDLDSMVPVHLLLVLTTPTTGAVTIGDNQDTSYPFSLIYFAKHNTLVTDEFAAKLYGSYVGTNRVSFNESDRVTISEHKNDITKSTFLVHVTRNQSIISV